MSRFNRLFWLFIFPNIAFIVLCYATKNTQLIGFFNILNFCIALMVVVAFSPVVWDVLMTKREIDHADLLGMGIFLGWSSTIVLRAYSIAWRWAGQPQWLTDSDILNYGLMLQMCAGIFHLFAPGAINSRIPSRHWIRVGVIVGICMFMALVMGWLLDASALDYLTAKK